MRLFRRAVILSHRYLGIVLSLLVIMWFATGITMMYWGGMPRVTPEQRLDRPAYRFGSRNSTVVFADTGDVLDELSLEQAKDVAVSFTRAPASQVHYVRTLHNVDQWTLQSRLPLQ